MEIIIRLTQTWLKAISTKNAILQSCSSAKPKRGKIYSQFFNGSSLWNAVNLTRTTAPNGILEQLYFFLRIWKQNLSWNTSTCLCPRVQWYFLSENTLEFHMSLEVLLSWRKRYVGFCVREGKSEMMRNIQSNEN